MAYDSYCGTLEDVLRVCKSVRVGNDAADPDSNASFTPDQAEKFLREADAKVNSELRPLYYLPLVKVLNPGDTDRAFPDPIPMLAKRICAGLLIESVYLETEPAFVESGKAFREAAEKELNDLVIGLAKGTTHLQGQELKARDLFINPRTAPLAAPPRPRS